MAEYAKTLRELAAKLGKAESTLEFYRARGLKLKKTARGYNVGAARRWIADNVRERPGSEQASDDRKRFEKARADWKEAQAKLAKLQAEIETGQWVPLDRVKARDCARIRAVRNGLLAWAKSLPPVLVGLSVPEMGAVIDQRVRELLHRFATM